MDHAPINGQGNVDRNERLHAQANGFQHHEGEQLTKANKCALKNSGSVILSFLAHAHPLQKWQKRWFVLHNTSSDGVVRIEYYDDEAGEMAEANKRTVVLRGFGECRQLPGDKLRPYVFELTSQIGK